MKRAFVAALTAAAVGGGVFGFAATTDVGSAALSAGGAVIPTCQQSEIRSSYGTTWNGALNAFVVDEVTVSNVEDGCDNHDLGVALTGGSDQSTVNLLELEGTTGTAGSVVFEIAQAIPASAVTGVQVVVSQ